ncbi:hypothetical protein [Terasakiella pusilla]|uniref:hypothetical protein n=1 Tax=Terasakiella pusilla TaxID=64973 RepID=UPI003AA84A58
MALFRGCGGQLMGKWLPVDIASKLYEGVSEEALNSAQAAMENAYVTQAQTLHRFPGLSFFAEVKGKYPVYLSEWKEDLIAVTGNGSVYRCDESGNVEDVTGTPVSGGRRVVFTKSSNELIMAAGGPIIKFAGHKTEVLAKDAPETTFVGHVDNYTLAIEPFSNRFSHAAVGDSKTWEALDVFSADSQPDDLNGLFVTPYRELILAGKESIEQFERLTSGEAAFFRRWAIGEGTEAPYTMVFADNAVWVLNKEREFVRLSGQIAQPVSDDVGTVLGALKQVELEGAWADKVSIENQKFILMQFPHANTPYGDKGLTYALDYKNKKWTVLYGWDQERSAPAIWPGVSLFEKWGRSFVGGLGGIYELKPQVHLNAGEVQRMLGRTAHFGDGEYCIDNARLRLKRGVGSYSKAPQIMLRCKRDNKHWSKWVSRDLGKSGQNNMIVEFGGFGWAEHFQFEFSVTDDCPIEIRGMDVQVTSGAL